MDWKILENPKVNVCLKPGGFEERASEAIKNVGSLSEAPEKMSLGPKGSIGEARYFEVKHGFEALKNMRNLSEAPAPSNPFIILNEWRNVNARLFADF